MRNPEDGTLPRPLQRSVPREVALNASGWVAAIAAAALLLAGLAGGPLLAYKLMDDSTRAAELHTSGLPAEGVVTEVRRSREKKPRVTISYRYSVNGREFVKRAQLHKNDPTGREMAVGASVRLIYVPSEPGRSWLEGYGPREEPVWVAAILPAVGVPGALVIILLLQRQLRLLRDGRAAIARVIGTEKRSKYQESWRVTYTWSLLNGAIRKAHLSRTSEPAGSGSFVPVIYDPDLPERHCVYPLSMVRLR